MINGCRSVLVKYTFSLLIFEERPNQKRIRPGPVRVANFDVSPLPFRASELQ